MTLPPERHLRALGAEGAALARAARRDLWAQVPARPEWTVADLVEHASSEHRRWTAVLAGASPSEVPRETPPAPALVVEWYEQGLAALVAAFEAADPGRALQTAGPGDPDTVARVLRRTCRRTALWPWDAEAATGPPRPLDPELASDAIDGLLFEELPRRGENPVGEGRAGPGPTVHLHCTDAWGEWLVSVAPGGRQEVRRLHAKGDAALRGSASDLLLALCGRIPPGDLEILGDPGALHRLIADIPRP